MRVEGVCFSLDHAVASVKLGYAVSEFALVDECECLVGRDLSLSGNGKEAAEEEER